MKSKDLSIVLCGAAGQGIKTVEHILVHLLKQSGFHVFATKEYMSRIRGGSNSTEIRVSSERVAAPVDRIDILLPFNEGALWHLQKRISAETVTVGDRANICKSCPAEVMTFIDIPLADLARDLDYLEKYIMPMEDLWQKHREFEGSGIERYVWQRVMLSPFYSYGKYKYDKNENIVEKSLDITIDYLKLYTKLWADVEKADPEYMKLLNERKRIMLDTMREYDPGEGPLKKALGAEAAHKILALLF